MILVNCNRLDVGWGKACSDVFSYWPQGAVIELQASVIAFLVGSKQELSIEFASVEDFWVLSIE